MRFHQLACIAVVFVLAAAPAAAQITPEEFTDLYVQKLNDQSDNVSTSILEPLSLTISNDDGQEVSVNLQDVDSLTDIVVRYAVSSLEALEPHSDRLSITNIVPIVKDSKWVEEVTQSAQGSQLAPTGDLYMQSFAPGLTIMFAEDTPTSIRYVDKSAIAESGVDQSRIREIAIENLLEKISDIELLGSDGLYMIAAGGNYEASLMLVDGIWSNENFDVRGDIVVSIPARDSLLVTGTENGAELERVREISSEIYGESPYKLTTELYVRRGGKWELFD